MNTGYGMPSRRRLRGPLHPRNRPPPSSFEDALTASSSQEAEASSSAMPPPSSTPSGKKREWTATIGRGGVGSLLWEQMGPSSSGPSQPNSDLARAEFSFQSGMGFPTSTSAASMASLASMPSSSSASSFASFRQQQTPMSASPSSFRTAADADESASYSARNTIFSRGNQSAQAALRESSRATQDPPIEDDPPRKRRRGLAGAIVDTALNAALYTGAAALTAYSLWTSWGQTGDNEDQSHRPDAGPEADMGHVISQNKRAGSKHGAKEPRLPPGGLEEPPPPYYEDQGTPSRQQQPSTPQSNSVRMRKVFVSSQRNRRRPTFQGSKTHRQSTPRKALPDAFRSSAADVGSDLPSSSSQLFAPTDTVAAHSNGMDPDGEGGQEVDEVDEEEDDEDDEMLSRFEAKMNALIAEGQAALNSTPALQEADLREIDTPSPSLGMTASRSSQHLSSRASQRFFDASTDSPFSSRAETLDVPAGFARSSSNPDQLATAFLPEPVKRTFGTATASGLRQSRSTMNFNFESERDTQGPNSPFVFGQTQSPVPSPSVRAAGTRRVTDFAGSPSSRIPRARRSMHPRP